MYNAFTRETKEKKMRDIKVGERVVLVESDWLYDDGQEPRGVVVRDLGQGGFVILWDDGEEGSVSEEQLAHE
jgi:hypothetical protein